MLDSLDVDRCARKHKWMLRKPRKINAKGLLTSFCSLVFDKEVSFDKLAMKLGVSQLGRVSPQAVFKRVNGKFVSFLRELVSNSMAAQAEKPATFATSPLFAFFHAVFIQDSSCIWLPDSLSGHYPGSANKFAKKSIAKLEVLLDIKSWRLARLLLNPFQMNDQSQAKTVVGELKPGTLLIRDLGYFCIQALTEIDQAGAFFLTRLKFGAKLYDIDGKPIVLETLLLRKGRLDKWVRVGKEKALVRLIALPLPLKEFEKRCKNARENRDKRCNHGPVYMFRLGWTILLTNVPEAVWTAEQALEAYGFRWQVETMFKSWKSYLGVDEQSTKHKIKSPYKAEAIIYAQLLIVTNVLMPLSSFHFEVCQQEGSGHMVSPLKLAMFLREYVSATTEKVQWIVENIRYYCSYDKRKRRNLTQKLYQCA